MTPREYAGWLADKIPAYGDYAKEAAAVLIRQADEIERLRHVLTVKDGEDEASFPHDFDCAVITTARYYQMREAEEELAALKGSNV